MPEWTLWGEVSAISVRSLWPMKSVLRVDFIWDHSPLMEAIWLLQNGSLVKESSSRPEIGSNHRRLFSAYSVTLGNWAVPVQVEPMETLQVFEGGEWDDVQTVVAEVQRHQSLQ